MLTGIGIFLFPAFQEIWIKNQNQRLWDQWEKENAQDDSVNDHNEDPESEGLIEEEGSMDDYEWIRSYNEELFRNGQSRFNNEAIVEEIPEGLHYMENVPFGFIEIPAMEVMLPIYLGASEEHLAMGAAVLGETSIPIGGASSNAVIAGHRGYQGFPFFRQIEDLSIEDSVYIINTWGRLHYRVSEIQILEPDESDALRIREGEDLITLLTCHPYRSNGRQRYAVFCRREMDEEDTMGQIENGETKTMNSSDDLWKTDSDGIGNSVESSQADLRRETVLRRFGAGIILLCLIRVGRKLYRNRRQQNVERD